MSKVDVRMNSAGCRELLRSGAVKADLDRRAKAIADRANSAASPDAMRNQPYRASSRVGSGRARATVGTSSPHGRRDNAKKNTLLKSLDAGR